MLNINDINTMPDALLRSGLEKCCGSNTWIGSMMNRRPFVSIIDIMDAAQDEWVKCSEVDFLEAFSHHPKIGDKENLKQKFAATASWAGNEQSGVNEAQSSILDALLSGNAAYEKKFGFIFIVFATGKSAEEMLQILYARLENDREEELIIAAAEQAKITALRLQKWINQI